VSVAIKVCTLIEAPPARVWEIVEAIERHTDWMADAERITFVTPSTRGVGTAFDCLTRVGPVRLNDRMTVIEWDAGRSIGIEHRGIVRGAGRFTVAKRRHGRTRFCWHERLRFPWWMGGFVGERVAKPVLRKLWRGNLERLKNIAETTG
jgi:uncharacterized protein YndB with AHSA1/START domain